MFFAVIGGAFIIGIPLFIILLVLSSRKNSKALPDFYGKHSLIRTNEFPPEIREAIGAENNPTGWRGNLTPFSGGEVSFYWSQWYTTSSVYAGDGRYRPSYRNYLAVSFPPDAVSAEFEQKAGQTLQKNDLSQNIVNALVVDSRAPIRVEKLADGSFLIVWQISEQVTDLEDKIAWLKNNVAIRSQSKNVEKVISKQANYQMTAADVSLTLMIEQPNGEYAPSSKIMIYKYFFLVPEMFAGNPAESLKQLMHEIYKEHYIAFKLKDPNDPNYIVVVGVEPKIMTVDECANKPWLTSKTPMWENSNCILVQNNGYQKIEPNNVGGILGLA